MVCCPAKVKKNQEQLGQQQILRRQGLLESLASLACEQEDEFFKLLRLHFGVIKSGVVMAQHSLRLVGLGQDAADRARKDKKRALISQVLSSCQTFKKAHSSLSKFKDDHDNSNNEGVES